MKEFISSDEYGLQLGDKNTEAVIPDFFLSPLPCSLVTGKCKYLEVTTTIVN